MTQAEPGMTLAEAVNYSTGMILAGAGVVLTETMIDRMLKAGIGSVVIEGESGDSDGELQAVLESLPNLFRHHRSNAFMMTLHNMLRSYFRMKLAESAAAAAARKAAQEAAPDAEGQENGTNGAAASSPDSGEGA
ncbi:hypothetical protein LJC23_06060 [Desulfovibrio sp. OttesenSCG-928-I05]|nr:hypothetical protein [Desulfovibrio sp. OttesenSCG-928-I05]